MTIIFNYDIIRSLGQLVVLVKNSHILQLDN